MQYTNIIEYVYLAGGLLLDVSVTLLIIGRLQASGLLQKMSKYILLLFNVLFLFLCTTLTAMSLSVGAGLGLFAILTILRFRGQVVRTDELISLLLLIGLGLIHAAFPEVLSLLAIVMIDGVLVALTFLIGKSYVPTITVKIKIRTDDLAKYHTEAKLQSFIERKVGMKPEQIEVSNINLLDGTACLCCAFTSRIQKAAQVNLKDAPEILTTKRTMVHEMIS